jgi:hypothetical protein
MDFFTRPQPDKIILDKELNKKDWNKKAFIYRLFVNKCNRLKRKNLTKLLNISNLGIKNGRDICQYVSKFIF